MIPDHPNALLAWRTILQEPDRRVPSHYFNVMDHTQIERLACASPGDYIRDPDGIFVRAVRNTGSCSVDQYLADNPLSMGNRGFENAGVTATTGASEIVLDGMAIDSPESVATHLERYEFPRLAAAVRAFDDEACAQSIVAHEAELQDRLGPCVLKLPYGHASFPYLRYTAYGYAHYFACYALYPAVMERDFALQADLAELRNRTVARTLIDTGLPPFQRLDHDIADSRGTLVSPASLERTWFPHFARAIAPLVKAGIRLVWHCDGNLMAMLPQLIDCGVRGFQGFQYEDGMDYARICAMRTADGTSPIIFAGVSVTRTLPFGTPNDVKREIDYLVSAGPKTGLFLATSSSVTPGVPWDNLATYFEGLKHYATVGR